MDSVSVSGRDVKAATMQWFQQQKHWEIHCGGNPSADEACPSDIELFYGVYSFIHINTASLSEPWLIRYYFRDYFRLLTVDEAHTASFL
jgi:hypothetical protein